MAKTKLPAPELVPLARIKANPNNPRVLRDERFEKLKESIVRFPDMLNFRAIVAVTDPEDGRLMVLGGNMRLRALQDLGIKEAPVLVADHWSEEERAQFVIKDNVSFGDWNFEALASGWGKTALLDWGMELPSNFGMQAKGKTDPDETPEPPANPVSQLGDVWLLGTHRLVCGDSTNAETVAKCLNGVQPHLMVTDPPYGVNYNPKWRVKAGVNRGTAAAGLVRNDDRADWRAAWALFPGDVAYVWHGGAHAHTVADSLLACGLQIRSQIIWNNGRLVIGRSDYHWQHEPCWYVVREGKPGHYVGDRKQTTVWDIPKPKKLETGHSTQKPVECMKRPIENNSNPGQAVYEPFSGSGTTIIAGEMTGRHVHAIELAPEYVDVDVKRWQDFTGKKAIHEQTGLSFEELAQQRRSDAA